MFSEVEDFLTDEECESIIMLAKYSGLKESSTVRTNKDRLSREQLIQLFSKTDLNADGVLENHEVFDLTENINYYFE